MMEDGFVEGKKYNIVTWIVLYKQGKKYTIPNNSWMKMKSSEPFRK